jgi:hypothetical protein
MTGGYRVRGSVSKQWPNRARDLNLQPSAARPPALTGKVAQARNLEGTLPTPAEYV